MARTAAARNDEVQTDEAPQTTRVSKSQQIADRIVELLEGQGEEKSMNSAELHDVIFQEFQTSGLYGARQILGDRVQTGVRVEGQSHWKLVE